MEPGYYHVHVHNISRRKGHNIHAAVAYRHGILANSVEAAAAYRHAQLHGNGADAFDYRRKVGVEWVGMVAPDDVPAWMKESKMLWPAIDRYEKRVDARLAKEVVIGLPHQVDVKEHIAMLTEFARTYCVDPHKLIADIAIHAPPTKHGGDIRHWHAHVLLTDRPADKDGFVRVKDRRLTDKVFILALREGWTLVHNRHMERLGLPYRIDHRTLERQRADALERGDEEQAILLDRVPQVRLGKAAHASHPRYAAYQERLKQNQAILATNSARAEQRHDDTHREHIKIAQDAHRERNRNLIEQAKWQLPPPDYHQLHRTYGRPDPVTRLGRLRERFHEAEVHKRAIALMREHKHPWTSSGDREGAPSILDAILGLVRTTGPGHPVFTVTAKDLAFAFYKMGLLSLPNLQASLESIALEEQRLFANRIAKKTTLRQPPPIRQPKPPTLPRPHYVQMKKLEKRLGHTQNAIKVHHQREQAARARYIERTWARVASRRDLTRHHDPYARGRVRTRVAPGEGE